ncbi:MAG TPA: hypothetical protein VIY69_09735 [Candidatus Acidoferrales bacterium]
MQYVVVGILRNYGHAEAAVQELEQAGIVGEQVEMITDIDEDARTESTPAEPSTVPGASRRCGIARLFGAGGDLQKSDVRDEAGEMPNYIGEQEFYANHVRQGGVVLVVRTSAEPSASRAAAILQEHGARTPGQKDGPIVRRVD